MRRMSAMNFPKETKMHKHLFAAATALGLAVALPAMAQTSAYDAPHPYAGGGIGINDESETAWRLLGGYRFHRNIAVELGYTDLGEVSIGGRPADAKIWELVGLGIFPINDLFSVYGKLGAYRGEAKGSGTTERNNDLTYGIGGQYDFNRNLGVRVEWQRYTDFGGGGFGAKGEQDVLSLNAIYKFR